MKKESKDKEKNQPELYFYLAVYYIYILTIFYSGGAQPLRVGGWAGERGEGNWAA